METNKAKRQRTRREPTNKTDKVTLKLEVTEATYQHLEALAVGLAVEDWEKMDLAGGDSWKSVLERSFDDKKGDFGPAVERMMHNIIVALSTAVSRPGSWERMAVDQLTGWEGTLIPSMFGEWVDVPNLETIEE